MKNIIRDDKGKFAGKRHLIIKVVKWIWIAVLVMGLIAFLSEKYVNYRLAKEWLWDFPIKVSFHRILTIQDRPTPTIVSPTVIGEIEQGDVEVRDPIDQKIFDLWGERYYLLARSIFKCESGLRAEAVNWTTKDIGVTQINYPTWKKPVEDKFGFTLVDLFDPMKNLDVAYWIWDRADGVEGDSKGSFEPWVAYTSGSFVGCVE